MPTLSRLLLLLLGISAALLCAASLPPKTPPEELLSDYTRDGTIPLDFFYVDDTMNGEGTHFRYTQKQIDQMEAAARKHFQKIEKAVDYFKSRDVAPEVMLLKLRKDDWLHFALLNYTAEIVGKRVVVVGSISPWVETLCLAVGAASVTTVEYNRLTYGGDEEPEVLAEVGESASSASPRMTTVSGAEFEIFYAEEKEQFDVAFSMSSLDHDGLGRYGDPLNPNGDLEAMRRIRSLVKPGGLMFLTVPIGPDVVVFNLHRRYGAIRLPLLLDGWDVEKRIGWKEEALSEPANWRQTFEPVLILRKPHQTLLDHQNSIININGNINNFKVRADDEL